MTTNGNASLADRLRAVVDALPDTATVTWPVADLRRLLHDTTTPDGPRPAPTITWRERLWTVPATTRIGVREVAEALGVSHSWVYRAGAAKHGGQRLPFKRLGGELLATAGDVRDWIERQERPA